MQLQSITIRRALLGIIAALTLFAFWQPQPVHAGGEICYQPGRLSAGAYGRVTPQPNLPNRLRAAIGLTADVIGRIPAGASFRVLSGPYCTNGLNWWQVNYRGTIGYTAEGNGYGNYWLEPIYNTPPQTPYCALPTRLTIGQQGRVTPGLPNVLRTAPGTTSTGANSQIIGEIPALGVFTVLNGPQCGTDGRMWWYVNHSGLIGWTAEGEGTNTYWLEPIYPPQPAPAPTCPGAFTSRLTPGGLGAVTHIPNLPNTVRAQPNIQSNRLGQIPVGGVFNVLSGPYCNNGGAWWQVSYGNLVGWTLESGSGNYWLEPR